MEKKDDEPKFIDDELSKGLHKLDVKYVKKKINENLNSNNNDNINDVDNEISKDHNVKNLEKKMFNSATIFRQILVSPIHDAANQGDIETLKDIVEGRQIIPIDSVASGGGANTSKTDRLLSKDRAGNTPLHWCCGSLDSEDHLESIKYLIEEAKKENIDILHIQNNLGDIPLHRAVWRNNFNICKLLIESNSQVSMKNYDNKLPIDLVRQANIGVLVQGVMHVGVGDINEEEYYYLNLSDTSYSSDDEEEEEEEFDDEDDDIVDEDIDVNDEETKEEEKEIIKEEKEEKDNDKEKKSKKTVTFNVDVPDLIDDDDDFDT
eukprot:TRINITY_DN501_c3_g1_i1.p1 TRINITY_DN501_c3_g1~~TRINITY_DN501_c3_g1_i1.p1  ORF type:complete len:320 (-),score=145.30 TRINITY_DN501_c3_g1_i1:121-1080(-)